MNCTIYDIKNIILLVAAIFLFVSRNRITLVNLDFGKCGNEMLLD